ncbi:hypothetical protein BDK51DRAFT_35331, partial [Blyttiomyces helicus]
MGKSIRSTRPLASGFGANTADPRDADGAGDDPLAALSETADAGDYSAVAAATASSPRAARPHRSRLIVPSDDGIDDLAPDSYPESEEDADSDALDDDLIIEALNSGRGKTLLERRKRRSQLLQSGGSTFDNDTDPDDEPGANDEDDDDDDADVSSDERRRRALADLERGARRQRNLGMELPTARIAALYQVDAVRIRLVRVELVPDFANVASLSIEHRIPVPLEAALVTRVAVKVPMTARTTLRRAAPMVVPVDRMAVIPCRFDAATVKIWMREGIPFKVAALQAAGAVLGRSTGAKPVVSFGRAAATSTAAAGARKSRIAWTGMATLPCKDVLRDAEMRWEGPISIWTSAVPAGGDGLGGPSEGDGARLLGKLIVALELVAHDALESRQGPERATAAPESPTKDKDHANDTIPVKDAPSVPAPAPTADPPLELPSGPFYFHVHITTARSLSVAATRSDDATLVHLVARLFSSGAAPIETPPIAYTGNFDPATGRIADPPSFDMNCTVPLAITAEFVRTHQDTPLIVEVRVSEPAASSSALLGLVKLPFHQLLRTLVAQPGPHRAASDMPIMVPDAEYPVIDPFSGAAKGWVRAFLALGSWDQISRVRKREEGEGERAERLAEARRRLREEYESGEILTETPRDESGVSAGGEVVPPAEDASVPAECSLHVTIHRACGLAALLDAAIAVRRRNTISISDDPPSSPLYTPLDFAREVGPNPYIRLRLFPVSVARVVPEDGADDNDDDDPTMIATPVLARTFTPTFDYAIAMTIRGVDAALVRWMREGGEARGEIVHRSPRDVDGLVADDADDDYDDDDSGEDIVLGSFRVPLKPLVSRPAGFSGWVAVESEGEDAPEPVRAAVLIAARFHSGFDLVEDGD